MRACLAWLTAILLAGFTSGVASADHYPSSLPPAEDTGDPGWYSSNGQGCVAGRKHSLKSCCQHIKNVPHNCIEKVKNAPHNCAEHIKSKLNLPWLQPSGHDLSRPTPQFPTHPYMRSPRDFFMME